MLLNIIQETLHFEYKLVVECAGPWRASSVAMDNGISGDADIRHEKSPLLVVTGDGGGEGGGEGDLEREDSKNGPWVVWPLPQ